MIKEVIIKGNNHIVSASILNEFQSIFLEKKLFFLRNNNLNLFNSYNAEQKIKNSYPRIEEINIKKQWPNKIVADIKEKEVAEILCNSKNISANDFSSSDFSKCFFIDKNGIAFEKAADTQGFLILKILDNRGGDIEIDKKVLNAEFLSFVGDLKTNFKNYINSNIKLLILEHPAQREVSVLVDNWRVIFDVSGNARRQLFVLKEVMEKEIKDQKNKLDYIDLRVDGRAYYKLK